MARRKRIRIPIVTIAKGARARNFVTPSRFWPRLDCMKRYLESTKPSAVCVQLRRVFYCCEYDFGSDWRYAIYDKFERFAKAMKARYADVDVDQFLKEQECASE
jgi:hypothetical protein